MKILKICMIIIALFIVHSLSAQTYNVNTYFNNLKRNLSSLESFDDEVQNYCRQQQQNFNIVVASDNVVNFGFEQYELPPQAQDYYEGFQNLDYLDKCRLLFSWNRISETVYEIADQKRIPRGIAYLPIIFTAMNEYYSGSDYRYGIWGLQYLPAVKYGIVADSCYEERLDISRNTYAALSYLDELHRNFRTWDMAITAYCCGPASVRRAGFGDQPFDSVYNNLNCIDKDSFYRLLAITKWMGENETIDFSNVGSYSIAVTDTILVNDIIHFGQIAGVLGIDINLLRSLNPLFVGNYIDGRKKPKIINIPESYKIDYIKLHDSIQVYLDSVYFPKYIPFVASSNDYTYYNTEHVSVSPGDDYEEIKYKIVSGDNLGTIAEKYDVKVVDLKDWNNISGTNIYAGQTISIWVKKGTKQQYEQKQETTKPVENKPDETNKAEKHFSMRDYDFIETYEIQPGDSPYGIALNYDWASAEDIMFWNGISDPSKLQVGQKLKIFKKKK